MPTFLMKGGKILTKGGRFVASDRPADCDCCNPTKPPEPTECWKCDKPDIGPWQCVPLPFDVFGDADCRNKGGFPTKAECEQACQKPPRGLCWLCGDRGCFEINFGGGLTDKECREIGGYTDREECEAACRPPPECVKDDDCARCIGDDYFPIGGNPVNGCCQDGATESDDGGCIDADGSRVPPTPPISRHCCDGKCQEQPCNPKQNDPFSTENPFP
jgi:hypothetical protein